MSNYRYKIIGEDIILSQEEHEKVLKSIKEKGGGIVFLRNEALAINTALIGFSKETEQMTEEQESARENILKLEGEKYIPPTAEDIKRRRKMVEDWKNRHAVKEMQK